MELDNMENEKEMSELEKLHKKTKNAALATLCLFLIGMMMVAATVIFGISWSNIMQDNHLENPQMPIDQYPENATYIWTHNEIMKEVYTIIPIGIIGIGVTVIAFGLLYLLPDKKDFHKLGCKSIPFSFNEETPKIKYCPECGLKLSELEPKKKHDN
jgi:hypothetical protein